MLKSTITYQNFSKITATLLLLAFLIPSGLQAKQLVDFCMMIHHDGMELVDSHNCCTEEVPSHHDNEQSQHDCGILGFCACDIGDTTLSNSQWTLVTNGFSAVLSKQIGLTPFIASDEPIRLTNDHNLSHYKPPLWLMYDTFLM